MRIIDALLYIFNNIIYEYQYIIISLEKTFLTCFYNNKIDRVKNVIVSRKSVGLLSINEFNNHEQVEEEVGSYFITDW